MFTISKKSMFITILTLVFAVFFLSGGAAIAKTQKISILPESSVVYSSETVAMKIMYEVTDGNSKTTGIGIRIHFHSKFIDAINLSDVYGEGMIGQHYSPQSDDMNFDGDVATDKYIIVAWAGITGNWPVFLSMPGSLATMNVVFKKDAPNAETSINVSASAVAAGCKFNGKSAKILIQ